MRKNYLSTEYKTLCGNIVLRTLLEHDPKLSKAQAQRILGNIYYRIQRKHEDIYERTKNMVTSNN